MINFTVYQNCTLTFALDSTCLCHRSETCCWCP